MLAPGIAEDSGRESVTLVCVHHRIIPFLAFNLSVPVEAIVEPDCVADDIWWESVTSVGIHAVILIRVRLV